MIDKLERNKCTGCFACAQKCPKKCISIEKDDEGFLIPVINHKQCIGCNICEGTCPQLNAVKKNMPIETYAAHARNEKLLIQSTSGGIFAIAAYAVLEDGGIVFGVEMTDDGFVRMCAIEKKEDLHKLQGSKYVQAYIGESYIQAKEYLLANRIVLFSGTPCQIAGLNSFLGKTYEKLYTIEIVCHGVPSQEMFSAYRAWLGQKLGSEIKHWYFRNKEKDGWAQIDKLVLKDHSVYRRENLDPYTYSYLKSYNLRESCYECQFCSPERCADITVGDYWGLRNYHPDFYSELGVCLLLVNTEQGRDLLEKIRTSIALLPSDYEYMKKHNSGLVSKPQRPVQREKFYEDFKRKSMDAFVRQNMKVPFNMKEMLRQWIPHRVRLMVKDIFVKR